MQSTLYHAETRSENGHNTHGLRTDGSADVLEAERCLILGVILPESVSIWERGRAERGWR